MGPGYYLLVAWMITIDINLDPDKARHFAVTDLDLK